MPDVFKLRLDRGRAGVLACGCALLAMLAGVGGCQAIELVQPAGGNGPSVLQQVETARPVAVTTDDGAVLRGVWVPAAGGPEGDEPPAVVLHLLPTGASVRDGMSAGVGRIGLGAMLAAFSDEGLASLAVDYGGMGASDGPRRTARLVSDGRAMYQAAIERAGGDEERVVVRAGSLGTLVAAELLASGARPAAVVLIAPVRAPTVAAHARRLHASELGLAGLAGFAEPTGAADLIAALAATEVPVLLLLPDEDGYLPPSERALVEEAAAAGGHRVAHLPHDHQTLILRSWGFTIDPESFSGRRTPWPMAEEIAFLRELDVLTTPDVEPAG